MTANDYTRWSATYPRFTQDLQISLIVDLNRSVERGHKAAIDTIPCEILIILSKSFDNHTQKKLSYYKKVWVFLAL